jgi:2-octaprenyl-6-methoxyphenol hydroxylase
MALDQKSFTARLQDESHDELGTIRVISTPHCWPITLQIADRLFAPRTALVAEAAHALPPSGAQGLNLSLRDVAALSDLVIAHARVGLDVGSDVLLARYARTRSADITPRAYAVDGLNRLILSDQRAVRLLRRRGLAVASALPPVRHALMRFGWASA